ncbi:hypothetical protein G6F59_015176 [Rhizopus arrhizus]|nr:hypothetical protein G6F59_015176 [Rhizopus arrhizus]
MMLAVRAPQSKPAMTARSIFSASISAMMSTATTASAQVRDDDAIAGGGQPRHDVDEGVDVVRPAVQQDGDGAGAGAGVHITDIERAGPDLADAVERRGAAAGWSVGGLRRAGLGLRRAAHAKVQQADACQGGRRGEQAATPGVDRVCHGGGSINGSQGWGLVANDL